VKVSVDRLNHRGKADLTRIRRLPPRFKIRHRFLSFAAPRYAYQVEHISHVNQRRANHLQT
jgi:hypothetical protein